MDCRFFKDHIVLEYRIDIRDDVLGISPSRGTVLDIRAVLLGVFAFQVNSQPERRAAAQPDQQVQRVMLGNSIAVPCVAYIMQGITDAVNQACEKGGKKL